MIDVEHNTSISMEIDRINRATGKVSLIHSAILGRSDLLAQVNMSDLSIPEEGFDDWRVYNSMGHHVAKVKLETENRFTELTILAALHEIANRTEAGYFNSKPKVLVIPVRSGMYLCHLTVSLQKGALNIDLQSPETIRPLRGGEWFLALKPS